MSDLLDVTKEDGRTPVASAVRTAVERVNVRPITMAAGSNLQHEGDYLQAFYLVESGWLYSYRMLSDGRRQIVLLHQPGDIVGLGDAGRECVTLSVRSLRDCILQPLPRSGVFGQGFMTPAVASYLLRKSAEMQSFIAQTLVAVGRMDARHRIIWLLLTLHDRQNVVDAEGNEDLIEMPLNQSEIGDLLGLSNVSICKTLCQLSEEGFIERRGRCVALRRLATMRAMVDHVRLDVLSLHPKPAKETGSVLVAPGSRHAVLTGGAANAASQLKMAHLENVARLRRKK